MAEEEGAPKLSAIVRPKEVTLKKGKEWGLVLRGTTKLYGSSLELYTCRIDNVTPGGPAENAGLKSGDQIVSVNGQKLQSMCHQDTVRHFQENQLIDLVIIAEEFSDAQAVRVNPGNFQVLSYMWTLSRTLQHLEVVHVPLERHGGIDLHYLTNLESLRLTHCGLKNISCLRGIERLSKLTKLVLTHNSLGDDPFLVDSSISHLTHLQTLDLGMNELTEFPKVVIQLPTLEVLILVNNNISSLPNEVIVLLTNLHTLCLDGNQLVHIADIDLAARTLYNLKSFTFSYNFIDVTPHSISQTCYDITGIKGNPFTETNERPHTKRKQSILSDGRTDPRAQSKRFGARYSFCLLSHDEREVERRAISLSPTPSVMAGTCVERPISTVYAKNK